jgi:hypothetical protein
VGVESGTVFSEVDLENDSEWVDYDEKVRPINCSHIIAIVTKW